MKWALFLLLLGQIHRMIRLLFIPFFALFFFSCESSSREVDPLFYQISEEDSIRCMKEILDGIIEDAAENQRRAKSLYKPNIAYCGVIDVFRIMLNSRGDLMIDSEFNSKNVTEKTYRYFMCNRNLTSKETIAACSNSSHPGFEFPFYNRYKSDEIERRIKDAKYELTEVKKQEPDREWEEYYVLKVEEWEVRKRALEMINANSLPEISFSAHVLYEYQKSSDKSMEVLKQIALAFYQMRNYECLRYFKETYLNLYDRSQRMNKKNDLDKLEALELLHPASIYCDDWTKPSLYHNEVSIPEPPQ